MFKETNEKYKSLEIQKTLIDAYIEMTKYEYIKDGNKVKVQVTKENAAETLDRIKELEARFIWSRKNRTC